MAARILGLFQGTPTPATPEARVKNYLEIFRKAIQTQTSAEYDPQDLQDVQSKVSKFGSIQPDLDLVLWMVHILKYPDCFKASFPDGRPTVELLPNALEMSGEDFVTIMTPLISIRTHMSCSVMVEGREYTDSAINAFLLLLRSNGSLQPRLLSPETTYTLQLKEGKSRTFTKAEMIFLGLSSFQLKTALLSLDQFSDSMKNKGASDDDRDFFLALGATFIGMSLAQELQEGVQIIDLPDTDEQTIQFCYDLFTVKYNFPRNPPTAQLFHLYQYLKKPGIASNFLMQHPLFEEVFSSLKNTTELVLPEDCLEREDFLAEIKAFLDVCKKSMSVTLRQRDDFSLKFSRAEFEKLLKTHPSAFQTRIIICKNNEPFNAVCDFYLEVLTYLSGTNTLGDFKSLSEIDLRNYERKTIEHAYLWFKTGKYPTLSWGEESKLVSFLGFCSPESERHKMALSHFSKKTPCFTVNELNNMGWDALLEELKPVPVINSEIRPAAAPSNRTARHSHYGSVARQNPHSKKQYVQLGQEIYLVENLQRLRAVPLSKLTQPIYFRFSNGCIAEGSFDWLSLPADFQYSTRDNPIPVTDEILTEVYLHARNPQPFLQHKRLELFLNHAGAPQDIISINKSLLQSCPIVNLGNAALEPKAYWQDVSKELTTLPHATEIQLDGCEIVWPRGMVEAFIAHGNIQISDLSEMITHKIADQEKGVAVYRMYKAEWMSFIDRAISEIQSRETLDAITLCLSTIPNDKQDPPGGCELCIPIARPFFKNKIETAISWANARKAPRSVFDARPPRQLFDPYGGYRAPSPPPPEDMTWKIYYILFAGSIVIIHKVWEKYQPSLSVKDLVLNKYSIVAGGCVIGAAYYIFSNRHYIRHAWHRTSWKTISTVTVIAGAATAGLLWMGFAKKD